MSTDASNRTLTIHRTFDAPIQLLWQVWTQPEHIAQWWAPQGMSIDIVEHNFQVGGRWEYAMQMPNGQTFTSDGVYSVIVELEKIFSSANFKPMTEGIEMQSLFTAEGDKTHLTFHCIHPTEEYCRQQEKMGFYNGWGSVFDRLNDYLQQQ